MARTRRSRRGEGEIYQRRYKDRQGRWCIARNYTISYWRKGKRTRETTNTDDFKVAQEILRERLKGASGDHRKLSYDDLEEMIKADYIKKERNLRTLEVCRLPAIRKHFRGWLASEIDGDALSRYQAKRKRDGVANATINRETDVVRRMFKLAYKAEKVSRIPCVDKLPEAKPRRGFVERADIEAIKACTNDQNVKTLVDMMYITGWRWESELTTRKWSDIDFSEDAGELRLFHGEAKDRDAARVFPLNKELRKVINTQLEYVKRVAEKTGRVVLPVQGKRNKVVVGMGAPIIKNVFVREDGREIISIAKGLRAAFKKAGYEDLIPHDFRRAAVRNLVRAGVDRATAKKMVGHKTDSIFERYAIVDSNMMNDAGAKLDAFITSQPTERQGVVAIGAGA